MVPGVLYHSPLPVAGNPEGAADDTVAITEPARSVGHDMRFAIMSACGCGPDESPKRAQRSSLLTSLIYTSRAASYCTGTQYHMILLMLSCIWAC